MRDHSSATAPSSVPLSPVGAAWGFLGILAFSFTVPLTRIAVEEMDPYFVGAGRAVIAGLCAGALLLALRAPVPRGRQWIGLTAVALGVVAGFPLLTSVALESVSAGHTAVVVGVLPAATAAYAVVRGRGDRPPRRFWLASAAGTVAVAVVISVGTGGIDTKSAPLVDLLLVVAVLAGAVGYGEGARLSREMGAWQTICWALILALPAMSVLTALRPWPGPEAGSSQWASFTYLALVSMFLGFFAWYRGLAIGPVTNVSQIQLVQPVLSITWAAALLGEPFTLKLTLGAGAVVLFAGLAVTARASVAQVNVPQPLMTAERVTAERVTAERSG